MYILQLLKKNLFDRKLIFFMKKGKHIVNIKSKQVYVTILLFILYSI